VALPTEAWREVEIRRRSAENSYVDLPGPGMIEYQRLRECQLDSLKLCLHWRRLCNNACDSDSHYLLTLATLGDTTQIGLFLFLVMSPKVAKASTFSCRCHLWFRLQSLPM
jgi:hypothetical protein